MLVTTVPIHLTCSQNQEITKARAINLMRAHVRDGAWTDFAKVTTVQDRTFTHEWTPPAAGLYKVVAKFEGSNSYEWSNGEVMVRVTPALHHRSPP